MAVSLSSRRQENQKPGRWLAVVQTPRDDNIYVQSARKLPQNFIISEGKLYAVGMTKTEKPSQSPWNKDFSKSPYGRLFALSSILFTVDKVEERCGKNGFV